MIDMRPNTPRIIEGISAVVVVVVFVVALGYFAGSRTSVDDYDGLVAFDPPHHDLGVLFQNVHRIANFKLVNNSNDAVELVSVRTSCSCSVPPDGLQGKVLMPGDVINVPIRFDSGARSGNVISDSDFRLKSRNYQGKYSVVRATIIADIVKSIACEPNHVHFGTLRPGEISNKTVEIASYDDDSLELISWNSDFDFLSANLVKRASGSWVGDLQLYGKDVQYAIPVFGVLSISTSNERVPVLRISCSAIIAPEIEVVPTGLVLVDNGMPYHKLRVRSTKSTSVQRITANSHRGNRNVDHTVRSVESANAWASEHRISLRSDEIDDASSLTVHLGFTGRSVENEATTVSVGIHCL